MNMMNMTKCLSAPRIHGRSNQTQIEIVSERKPKNAIVISLEVRY